MTCNCRENVAMAKAAADIQSGRVPKEDVSVEGCDLSSIRQLRAMTPTDRAYALKNAANNLLRARDLARRPAPSDIKKST